ncbi:hypothetical protein FOA52_007102 [Chlamydomonas sp. UWO 241]|nr:hypothetical protein FOA52_007102 [Chlamydomonas sp. UWO 241]
MGRKLQNSRGADLYAHWRDEVTEQLNEELQGPQHEGSRFIVNCASQEYFAVVAVLKLKFPVHHCLFPGVATVHAKQARGAMVRHIVRCGATSIEDLRTFVGNDGEFKWDTTAPGGPEKLVFKRVASNAKTPKLPEAKLPAAAKRGAGGVASRGGGGAGGAAAAGGAPGVAGGVAKRVTAAAPKGAAGAKRGGAAPKDKAKAKTPAAKAAPAAPKARTPGGKAAETPESKGAAAAPARRTRSSA